MLEARLRQGLFLGGVVRDDQEVVLARRRALVGVLLDQHERRPTPLEFRGGDPSEAAEPAQDHVIH